MRGLLARLRSFWTAQRGRDRLDAEMEEEMRFHLEMEAQRLERGGLDAAEARRRARLAFGSVDATKEAGRDVRGLTWVHGLSLDLRLGWRMLVKYPGLAVVGGLAMAFAIGVGAASFELLTQVFSPRLALPGGERIVGLRLWDATAAEPERRALHDFAVWRQELEAVEDLGAFRTVEVNLLTGEGTGVPVEAARMSAAGFRVAGVPPLLGRFLLESDDRPGAPPVVVLGHDVWQRHFAGDPAVVGRAVRLGAQPATVVGVMPEGFAFPVAHSLWLPFGLEPAHHGPREGPRIHVFGRLARGASLAEARAELAVLGEVVAAGSPRTHERLRPQVLPYARSILAADFGEIDLASLAAMLRTSLNTPLVLFLVLVCGNVALLVFARAATREGEIAVRSALGASRGRIVAQFFAEALVLGAVAAVVGLAAASLTLRWGVEVMRNEVLGGMRLPFWFESGLSAGTVAYAALLTVLGAAIAGALPGLKVTRGLAARLRQAAAGGGGFRFGGVWTAVIVAQIAVTVPMPVMLLAVGNEKRMIEAVDAGLADEEFLAVRLEMSGPDEEGEAATGGRERLAAALLELERRVAAEPDVAGVTFADRLPRLYHPGDLVEIDGGGAAPRHPRWPGGYRISHVAAAPDFFATLEVPVLAGRDFREEDAGQPVVIVNDSFVERVLGGRSPLGRRVRYTGIGEDGEPRDPAVEPWHEIVGVVRDLGTHYADGDPKVAALYHPTAPGEASPVRMAIHVRGDAAGFAPRLRSHVAAVDPDLRLHDVLRFDRVIDGTVRFYEFWFTVLVAATGLALLLSLAGLYSVMAFTVAQRTREIAVRVALGADRRRIVGATFARPLLQLALGVLAGGAVLALLLSSEGAISPKQMAVLAGYLAALGVVLLLAAVVPTRRALRVEPAEALREEG